MLRNIECSMIERTRICLCLKKENAMRKRVASTSIAAILSAAMVLPALAEGHHEGRSEGRNGMYQQGRNWGGAHDIRHFEDHHLSVWRSGMWRHGTHEGRFGWWWFAAGMWYFYPAPIYPYPDPYIPPVVVVQQPAPTPESSPAAMQPQAQSWYYCETSRNYYPYVSSCPAGWKTVPATPPSPPAN